MRTVPVKVSAGPCRDACEPLRVIVMPRRLTRLAEASRHNDMTVATKPFHFGSLILGRFSKTSFATGSAEKTLGQPA